MADFTSFALDLVSFLGQEGNAQYCKFVKREAVPPVVLAVIDFIPEYLAYTKQDAVSDWSHFMAIYALKSPKTGTLSEVELLTNRVAALSPSTAACAVVQTFIDMHYADTIADHALEVAMGVHKDMSKIYSLLDDHARDSILLARERNTDISNDIEGAIARTHRTGLSWPLESLNTIIGPYDKQLIIVGSRPDGGKTSFLAHTAAHVAKHHCSDGKKVLWFNNEEEINAVKQRVLSSVTNMNEGQIKADPITARKLYETHGGPNVFFIEDATTISKIERTISKYEPALIIIDQLYKVRGNFGSKQELEAERFRQLCEWARNLAKHVAPCIVTNQLDGSAEGVKHPSMDTLYGSKTGAQGEADVILLIGRTTAEPDKRYLYTPKNKLTGRVQSAEVIIDKEKARYYDT